MRWGFPSLGGPDALGPRDALIEPERERHHRGTVRVSAGRERVWLGD